MSDYWYENCDRLNPGNVCILEDGTTVKLDRRVPGDGTDWYVLDQEKSYVYGHLYWTDNNSRIHPSEIKKGPAW